MGRDLQKKKRRSGRAPVRISNAGKKVLNPRGNSVVAKNWDKKETLAQNYKRLGLVSRLRTPAGGSETRLHDTSTKSTKRDPFAIEAVQKSIISEAKVERDENGNIIRVLHSQTFNPLNDPLNEVDSDSDKEAGEAEEWGGIADDENATEVVKSLIEQSRAPVEKKPRYQSEQEREWLERLMAKHGDDTGAMARDHKLNPMQQTAADIRKRIKKMDSEA